MQRYFSNSLTNNIFTLSKDDSYHIKKVMRMNNFDRIEIVHDSMTYICEIINLDNLVEARIEEKIKEDAEFNKKVILVQSLVNEQKMDLILQKSTELGISEIYAYKATNSVVKENDKSNKKIERWQRIVKEASEQSKRTIIPQIKGIISLKELIKLNANLKIMLSVNENKKSIKKVLQENSSCDIIIIVVGPEGGFTNDEEKVLQENNFISTTLGNRVLRTETASLAILSMINYEWMD